MKRIKVSSLLGGNNKDWVEYGIENHLLDSAGTISKNLYDLIVLVRDTPEFKDGRPTYAKVRAAYVSQNHGGNISQTTIKKALDILYPDKPSSLAKRRSVNLLDYVVKKVVLPLILDKEAEWNDKKWLAWHSALTHVVLPVAVLQMQVEVLISLHGSAALSRLGLPALAISSTSIPESAASIITVALENTDMPLETRSLQMVSQTKMGRTMSYQLIERSVDLARYAYDHFVESVPVDLEKSFQQVASESAQLIKAAQSLINNGGEKVDESVVKIFSVFLREALSGERGVARHLMMY